MNSKLFILSTLCMMIILAATSWCFAFSLGKYEKIKAQNGTISIPVAKVSDGKAHFYKFSEGGKEIAFFVAKAADGSMKAAFDACDSCYRSKKGYVQQGDKMNCNNCNQKFAINRLGPNATGGCNPGYLPSQVNGGNVLIKLSDVKNGVKYF